MDLICLVILVHKGYINRLAIFLLKLALSHCGKICASSGQWFWKNIFHTYHTSLFVKLLSCVKKHATHLGSWFGKQFFTKLTIFPLKNVFAPLHNVHFVDFDSPVSKIAPVSATGLYNVALEI